MIDYEKLRLAHELASKLSTHYMVHGVGGKYPDTCHEFTLCSWSRDEDIICSLDDLITKLESLTQPKPKYKSGDIVWFVEEGVTPVSAEIKQYRCIDNKISYIFQDYIPIKESELYPTRQTLIEDQIAYWINELKSLPEFSKLTGQYSLHAKSESLSDYSDEEISNAVEEGCAYLPPENREIVKKQMRMFYDNMKKDSRPLSSCCSVHAGTTQECHDTQSHQDEIDLHECQHENDAAWLRREEQRECKKCGEFYK